MSRCYLECSGAELLRHKRVRNDRDPPAYQRDDHLLADGLCVPRIFRVHGHRRISQHRLWSRRGHHDSSRSIGHEWIPDVPQAAIHFFMHDLDVGQGRFAPRAPVDQPLCSVQQPILPQTDEHLQDRPLTRTVHGEGFSGPVTGCPQPFKLIDDGSSRLLPPLPDSLHKGVSPDLLPGPPLPQELPFHHVLCGDPCMIGPRHPESVMPQHPLPSDQDVLKGIVQSVSHVEGAGDVRWRNHDGVGRLRGVQIRMEEALTLPQSVPAGLYIPRIVP